MSTVLAPRSKVEVDRIVATISRETKKITQSKKSALEFLIKHGFITKSGKLTKQYQ